MKESFILYTSYYQCIKGLSDPDKATLLDAFFMYHMDGELPEMSPISEMAFSFIRAQFDRNSEKYELICERNRNNGSKGGRPKKTQRNPENPVGYFGNPEKPRETLYDNDHENESENDNPPISPQGEPIDFKKLISFYHELCPKLPKVEVISESRKRAIKARVSEHGKQNVIEMLKKAGESKFLNGSNDRNWIAGFDWIFKPTNFVKVLEGFYSGESRNGAKVLSGNESMESSYEIFNVKK